MSIPYSPFVADLMAVLAARIVGGAVRNACLGRPVSDIDLATPLSPPDVLETLTRSGVRVLPTGLAHGTVTAVSDGGERVEITSLRRDVRCDGRRAVVEFSDSWEGDARRRDFTINALYLDAAGQLYDYTGGLADIQARVLRFIGDPVARIGEDYLRVLRFFRLAAGLGLAMDPASLEACAGKAGGLQTLARERVLAELARLAAGGGCYSVWRLLVHAGVLQAWGLVPPVWLADVRRRLSLPGVLAACGASWAAWPLSRAQQRDGMQIAAVVDAPAWPGPMLYRLLDETPWPVFAEGLVLHHARRQQPGIAGSLRQAWALKQRVFPYRAVDVQAEGFSGQALGEELRRRRQAWQGAGFIYI